MSHRTRIAALEKRLAPAIAMPMLIRITGGLPDADPMRTTVGGQELEREAALLELRSGSSEQADDLQPS